MTTEQILNTNLTENRKLLENVLSKIGPLAKYNGKPTMEQLERFVFLMQKKYEVSTLWILVSNENDTPVYTMSFRNSHEISEESYAIGTVHGMTLYETLAKASALLWSYKGRLKKR